MAKEIIIQRDYPYPIETVWESISTSDALAEWLMPNNIVLKIGAEFQFKTKPQPGFNGVVNCKIVDFEAPYFLQYTWQGGPIKKPTIVTFRLEETDAGTKLSFTHTGFEGLITQYIVAYILKKGWVSLLTQKILKYLQNG